MSVGRAFCLERGCSRVDPVVGLRPVEHTSRSPSSCGGGFIVYGKLRYVSRSNRRAVTPYRVLMRFPNTKR